MSFSIKITLNNALCLPQRNLVIYPPKIKQQEPLMKKLISTIIAFVSLSAFAQEMSYYSQDYSVTNVESVSKAVQIFNKMKTKTTRSSQCYNRAMAWSYDMFKDYGIKHEKVLIYYTNKYRDELDRKWGFHIAPLITVNGEKYAMDREFHKEPFKLNDWVKWFVGHGEGKLKAKRDKLVYKKQKAQSKIDRLDPSSSYYYADLRRYQEDIAEINNEMAFLNVTDEGEVSINCKKIEQVTYWDENPKDGWCFYQVIPMYYWGPPQLREMDRGVLETSFNMDDVWDARAQAFKDYKDQWKREYDAKEAKEERAKEQEREERRRRRNRN